MALMKCKECGSEVSTQADTCPKCGAKKPAKKNSGCLLLIGGILFIGIVGQVLRPSSTNKQTDRQTPAPTLSSQAQATPPQRTETGRPSACDNGDPEQVYRMLQEIVVYDRAAEEPIFIHIKPDFWSVLKNDPSQRKQLMESIANADVCLIGKPRSLYLLDPDSNMIGKATPSNGIQMQ